MPERYDVAVIGAGIVGVSTALHMLICGKRVLLIDRREPGQETSFGNAGIIGNSYVMPFAFPKLSKVPGILLGQNPSARIHYHTIPQYLPWLVDFYFKSLPKPKMQISEWMWPLIGKAEEEHRFLCKGTGAENHIKMTGRVALYRSDKTFDDDALTRHIAMQRNVPFEVFETDDFIAIEPNVRPLYKKAVRWSGTPCVDNPGALTTAYAERFVREGGTLLKADVRGLTSLDNGWQIETLGSSVEADEVAVCTGPWANEILKPLGYHFPLAIKRGYHQHYAATDDAQLTHAIVDVEGGYMISPMEGGYRLCTGVEFADLDAAPTPVQITQVLPAAKQLFPLGNAIEPSPWCGSRPCFADSLPVIGKAARHKGLWFNFGHGHGGLTMGPASGRLLTEMLEGSVTFCDPAPYRASRFSC